MPHSATAVPRHRHTIFFTKQPIGLRARHSSARRPIFLAKWHAGGTEKAAIPEGLYMRRQVCSVGAADAKCLLTVHPSHAFQRNATTAPCNASQRNNQHISRIRILSHSSGMHLYRRQQRRHFARTSLSLRPCCIPAYTYFIPNGIMSSSILWDTTQTPYFFSAFVTVNAGLDSSIEIQPCIITAVAFAMPIHFT